MIFVKKQSNKWKEMEALLKSNTSINPDRLSDLYISLTDDLAYCQTNYPKSETTAYVNQLIADVHVRIYKNKRESLGRIVSFWVTELPLIIYKYRMAMLTAFVIFFVSCAIGAISTAIDEDFAVQILGDWYVEQTLKNIEEGNPMGIYSSDDSTPMFFQITTNNIGVCFKVYIGGIFFSILSAIILISNGVMLGCFQYFFYAKNVLFVSVLSIWVHGTLEISAIVIAGGAGIAFGNGFVFPGTLSRVESFQRSARDSVKIIVGLIPIFIIAGLLEGFVTRHSDVSPIIAGIIILTSMASVAFYFVVYPYLLNRSIENGAN